MATTATPLSANGGADSSPTLSDVQHLWARYEVTAHADQAKNALIEDTIGRYDELLRKHHRYIEEHKQERENAQAALDTANQFHAHAVHMQTILNQNAFVIALIDGDSLLYHPSFLSQGAVGGQNVATLLHNAIIERIFPSIAELPNEVKIVVRVFADLKSLGEVCAKAGLITAPRQLHDFVGGFIQAKALFDFIDVGPVKELAAWKVMESFKLYIADFHCRQVVVGCDGGKVFSHLFEHCSADDQAHSRLTFIENAAAARAGLQAVSFPGIFRESNLTGQMDSIRNRVDSRVGLNAASGVFTPSRSITPSSAYSPLSNITNLDSNGMHTTNGFPPLPAGGPKPTTWATITTKNAHKPLTTQTPARAAALSPEPPATEILRNKKGQRLDRHMDYDRDEVLRIKKLKSCNQHYIGVGCCHYNAGKKDKCPHHHHYNFTAQDLKTLRVVARETPCKIGHECDNPKCIYGHQCPFPAPTEGSMRGIGCMNGDACRFPRSMHDMDNVPAKMTKVVGTF